MNREREQMRDDLLRAVLEYKRNGGGGLTFRKYFVSIPVSMAGRPWVTDKEHDMITKRGYEEAKKWLRENLK